MGIRRNFRPTNLVTNGNFVNGTTGWFGESVTLTVTDNIAYLKGLGTQSRIRIRQTGHLFQPENEVIYFKCKVRVRDSVCSSIYAEFTRTTGAWYSGTHLKQFPQQDVWYDASVLITLDATRYGNSHIYIQAFYADATTQEDKILEIQNVQIINLTALFGAGNEPTQAWCDLNIPNWFDGTLSGGKRIGGVR